MIAKSGEGKMVLITGASAGLGAGFAKAYAARGFDLALVARRIERLEALAGELTAVHGVKTIVIGEDLAIAGAESRVLQAVADQGRTVDILVNNAGFSIPQSFAAVAWERQLAFLMTLVVSACGLAHGVIPGMVELRRGAIINVASLAGFAPGAKGHTLYPGAKALAIRFSEALDAEYRDQGVRVTALCPGFTRTEFALANGTQAIMDASPRMFFQTTEAVVEAGVRGNERGKVIVIPGWHNQLAAFLLQHLPQGLVRVIVQTGAARYHLDA